MIHQDLAEYQYCVKVVCILIERWVWAAGGGRAAAPGAAGARHGRGRGRAARGGRARQPRVSVAGLHQRHQRLRTTPH